MTPEIFTISISVDGQPCRIIAWWPDRKTAMEEFAAVHPGNMQGIQDEISGAESVSFELSQVESGWSDGANVFSLDVRTFERGTSEDGTSEWIEIGGQIWNP